MSGPGPTARPGPSIVVGPMLRYVDEHRATIWVETSGPCRVTVRVGSVSRTTTTWDVHEHHFALIVIDGLTPATTSAYQVALDGRRAWPLADSPFPDSVIRTPDPAAPFRMAFGSCRRADPMDHEHLQELGADALVALAARMMGEPHDRWPDVLLMLGDQVYADEPSAAIRRRLEHDPVAPRDAGLRGEIRNFREYAWLYEEAWTPPPIRWLLSTVPVAMLLDDHDLRDDWNTSKSWRDWITRQPWWRDRVIAAYGSYWVYQHLGNLSPDDIAEDPTYAAMQSLPSGVERSAYLDGFAWDADVDPTSTRFSFHRHLGSHRGGVRLVAIDSRSSRQLDPSDRRMVDAVEWEWVRNAVLRAHDGDGAPDHLVLASTLPVLMLPGVHHLEGWNEGVAQGAWGRLPARFGEWFRQFLDLEHWAAFRESFADMTDLIGEVVAQPDAPATVLMLGGDVHCSYTARANLTAVDQHDTEIHQLTMSPFRNDIQRVAKIGDRLLNHRRLSSDVHRLARWAKVPEVDMDWHLENGPWFDNGVMIVRFEGRSARLDLEQADVTDDDDQVLRHALTFELNSPAAAVDPDVDADAHV